VPQNAPNAVRKYCVGRQKAHDEKRLLLKIEKVSWMRKNPILY